MSMTLALLPRFKVIHQMIHPHYRAEWERAQRLRADNDELRHRIAHLESAPAVDSLPIVS